ncbi:MAG: hypothetical protein AAF577_06930 [Pseudomonadota bacterium]
MKRFLILTVAGGALIAGVVGVTAQTTPANSPSSPAPGQIASIAPDPTEIGHRRGAHRAHHRGGRRMGQRLRRLRDQYDADGNGLITQTEIDEGRRDQIEEFDTNTDGALSIAEFEALWMQAMRERMVRRFQRHDRDGDGLVTEEEYVDTLSDLVERRDRTGDGALGRDDLRHAGRFDRETRERRRGERMLERLQRRFPDLFEEEAAPEGDREL